MFPNVRLLIAAVVASVVALSCGFAVFAVFRVNHEPLSRLAAGAAPLQLAAGNPMPPAAIPAPADSFGNRFPLNNGDAAGASAQVAPPQPATTASKRRAQSPPPPPSQRPRLRPSPQNRRSPRRWRKHPQPSRSRKSPEPDAKPNEVATTTPSEPPPPRRLKRRRPRRTLPQPSRHQSKLRPPRKLRPRNKPVRNQTLRPTHTATTTTAEPPPPEAPRKAAHRHRLAAKAQRARQARAIAPTVSQPAGIGGPFVPPPSRLVARPPRPRHARATVQPVSQPSGVGGPFVPPATH